MENTYMPSYEDMIKAGMHFGRKKSIFHPNMKPFVYTAKEHIYIMDLVRTGETIKQAVDYINSHLAEGKTILFVGVTNVSGEPVKSLAEALSMPYVVDRWLGGTLTNFKVIISRVKYLENLEKEKESGGFEKYTKKERILKDREIETMRKKYDGLRRLTKLPDAVFVSSLKESQLAVREAKRMNIPVIAIVNTDSDPEQVTLAITANDNARRSMELILGIIKQSCQLTQSKNLEN